MEEFGAEDGLGQLQEGVMSEVNPQWGKERVGQIERATLKHVSYHV